MAQDITINGTTYPAVEAVATRDSTGSTVMFYPDAVRYVEQDLTESQKEQARVNIGAAEQGMPDYVQTEAENVLSRVMATQGSRTFTFAAITDMHYGSDVDGKVYKEGIKHACKAMEYISKRIKLDALAVLGDYTDLYISQNYSGGIADVQDVNALLSGVEAERLALCGNHDFHTVGSPQISRAIFETSDNVVWGSRTGGYYHRDFEDYKLRIIALNTSETEGSNIRCSVEQYTWFASMLDLSAKTDAADWQILILSHHPLDWYENAGDGKFRFGNILDAYVNGKSWSGGGISCDYSGKNAARIICNVHGHIHNLGVGKIHTKNIANSDDVTDVWRMCVPESVNNRPQSYADYMTENTYKKVEHSADDTAFNVFCIDLDNHTIKAINYGAGVDRELVYYDPTAPKYTNMLTKAINSDGTPYRGTNGEIGYKVGYRINSSNAEVPNDDYCVTGFIPLKAWDYVYLKNMNFVVGDLTSQPNTRVVFYDSEFKGKNAVVANDILSCSFLANMLDENGGSLETGDAVGKVRYVQQEGDYYVRFSTKKIDETSIVTVNEPIV